MNDEWLSEFAGNPQSEFAGNLSGDFAADEPVFVSDAADEAVFAGDAPHDVQLDAPVAGPSGWRLPEPTGVQAVDDALEPLLDLDQLATADHVGVYEHAHRRLQDALADLDGSTSGP